MSLRSDHLQALALALIWVGFVCLTTSLVPKNDGRDSDGVYYAAMAGDPELSPEQAREAPFCYRLLAPAVVSVFPGKTLLKFQILAFICTFLTLFLLYLVIREAGVRHKYALMAMLLYGGVFWTVKFAFWSPCYPDYLTQLLFIAFLWGMMKDKWWLLFPLIILGAMQKESLLILAPAAGIRELEKYGWRHFRPYLLTAGLATCGLFTLWVIRSNINPANDFNSWEHFTQNWKLRNLVPDFGFKLFLSVFSGLGLILLVIALRLKLALQQLWQYKFLIFLLLAGIFLLFGGVDKARLFLYILPILAIMAGWVLGELRASLRISRFYPWILVILLLHFHLGNYLTPMGDMVDYLNNLVPMHSYDPVNFAFRRVETAVLVFLLVTFVFQVAGIPKRKQQQTE